MRRGRVGAGWARVTGRGTRGTAHGARGGRGRGVIMGRSPRPSRATPLGPQDPGAASPPLSRQLSRPGSRSLRRWRRAGMEPARLPRPRVLEPFWGNPAAAARSTPKGLPAHPNLERGPGLLGAPRGKPGTSLFEYSRLLEMSPLSSDNTPPPAPTVFFSRARAQAVWSSGPALWCWVRGPRLLPKGSFGPLVQGQNCQYRKNWVAGHQSLRGRA